MKLKNILLYFVIAIVAGLVAVFTYSRIAPPVTNEISYKQEHPAWFTSLPDDYEPDQLDFTYAAEKTVHGVVHVTTRRQRERGRDPMYEFFFGPREREREPVEGIGSGVIISEDGYIATNNHVIEGAQTIEVTLNDGRSFQAEIVGTDPTTDIALLKIEEDGLHYIEFGNSDELRVGQWVLAVGNPMNLSSTVTAGIVSAKGRGLGVFARQQEFGIESFIQTDAAVNRGSSGGALVNLRGELVGIPTLILSPTGAHAGNAFAIPVSLVRKVTEDLKEYGEVQRALLGVQIRDVTSELAREEGLDAVEGVFVVDVTDGGAAEDAGIEPGDVILRVDDTHVNSVPELQETIALYRPKDEVDVLIRRNGRTLEISVVLRNIEGHMDLIEPQEAFLGARLREAPDDLKEELNISHGVQVTGLRPGKLMSAGVQEGFIIVLVNDNPVDSPSDLREMLEDHEGGVLLKGIYPDGRIEYYGFGL